MINKKALGIIIEYLPYDSNSTKYIRLDLSNLNPFMDKEGEIGLPDISDKITPDNEKVTHKQHKDRTFLAKGIGVHLDYEGLQAYCTMLNKLKENNLNNLKGKMLIPVSGNSATNNGRHIPLNSFSGDYLMDNGVIIYAGSISEDQNSSIFAIGGVQIGKHRKGSIIIYDALKFN